MYEKLCAILDKLRDDWGFTVKAVYDRGVWYIVGTPPYAPNGTTTVINYPILQEDLYVGARVSVDTLVDQILEEVYE